MTELEHLTEVPNRTWLARTRTRVGLSQERLAERSGISQPTISRIERGSQVADREQIERLARAMGLDPDLSLVQSGYVPRWVDDWVDSPEYPEMLDIVRQVYQLPEGRRRSVVRCLHRVLSAVSSALLESKKEGEGD